MAENEGPSAAEKPGKRAYKRRGPGRPKGSGRGPGRPKGTTKTKIKASKGLITGVIAKQLKIALRAERAQLKTKVRSLVAKEVKKAIKAAFR
jgi:hypothetical protein